jgi:hypothetical protein
LIKISWKSGWKAKTPYGDKLLKIIKRHNQRPLNKVRIDYGNGKVEATSNHVLKSNGSWREFIEVRHDDMLIGIKDTYRVQNIEQFESTDAISVRSTSGAYYGCTSGEPILMH